MSEYKFNISSLSMGLLCSFALFFSTSALAQMLSPLMGEDFAVQQKFNPTFIKDQGIKEIRCEIEKKRDGDRIRKTQQVNVYHFYADGRLKMVSKINYKLKDTAVTYFEYVGEKLDCEVKNDAAGMFSYCYEYNADGLPERRMYGRATRYQSIEASVDPENIPGVTWERYGHSWYEDQLHTTLYNSANRPYQKEIRYYDENKYLIGYLKTFVMSSAKRKEDYTYNAGGWMETCTTNDGKKEIKRQFTYDEIGNILTEDLFKDGKEQYHLEYVYNESDMRIRAELKREEAQKHIVITTYTYTNR